MPVNQELFDRLMEAPDLFAALEAHGATCRSTIREEVNVVYGEESEVIPRRVIAWSLGSVSPLDVSFCVEGWKERLAKLFRSELQTGDEEFDPQVYITTDTSLLVVELLWLDGVRDAVLSIIEDGGEVLVRGERVVATLDCVGEAQSLRDERVLRVVAAVLSIWA